MLTYYLLTFIITQIITQKKVPDLHQALFILKVGDISLGHNKFIIL